MPSTLSKQQNLPILLLCEDEKAANLDKRALRSAGFANVRVMTSGIAAARLLAGSASFFEPQFVVCLNQLGDMDGEQFCAIIRQHPRLLSLPILLIMPNENEAAQMRALGCGASALLGRPYSIDTLKNAITRLCGARRASLREAAEKVDTRAFDEALATYGVLLRSERLPEDYFRVGMKCLEENRWPLAIAAFERALRDAQIRAEAELGIAAAYRGKGDLPRFKAWLARAAESFLRARRWNRARAAYAKLLQHDPSARNPFLAEAHRLIRQHEYEEAAMVLTQSINLLPKLNAGERYARVCLAADDPEKMLAALEENLERDTGGKYDFLGEEIRQSLDVMTRQRAERQRQHAEERKMRLAREMREAALLREPAPAEMPGQQQKAQIAPIEDAPITNIKPVAAFGADAPPVPEFNAAMPASRSDGKRRGSMESVNDDLDASESDAEISAIPSFGKTDQKADMPKGRFNELFSVVKLTWKLAKNSRKRA